MGLYVFIRSCIVYRFTNNINNNNNKNNNNNNNNVYIIIEICI